MRATARTTSAVTIVNALPTGVGAAVGIGLDVEVTVDLGPPRPKEHGLEIDHHTLSTNLTRESVAGALRRYDEDVGRGVTLSVRSRIPAGRGLKSSSAVSCAIVLAVARALEKRPSALEVARLSAEVSQRAGVSATGAFDDALASLVGGVVITDNAERTVLGHYPLDGGFKVALHVPRERHPLSPALIGKFQVEEKASRTAVDLARSGDWRAAMEANSALVERAMGYDFQGLRELLARKGAIAQGVSGMGPAYAAVAPPGAIPHILSALPPAPAKRLSTSFTAGALPLEEV